MQVKLTNLTDTKVKLTVIANESEMTAVKDEVLKHLGSKVKLAGFREGKAPAAIVEKNVDQAVLQNDFLEHAINDMYAQAVRQEKLRLAGAPEVSVVKFVPFSILEFNAEVEVIGEVKLPDYSKIKKAMPKAEVSAADVDEVLKSLQARQAERKPVDRAAKLGDEAVIDFKGTDTKGEAINGAEGKAYPLTLGSNNFIPGFEDNLVGLKAGESKTFDLIFPKDYGVAALASKKVTFAVTVSTVSEMTEPKLDDDFAAKAGPVKTLKELKDDIRKQLMHEKTHQVERNWESELVREIASKSKVAVPQSLVDEQVEQLIRELKQNLTYRGQTWQEYLNVEGKDEESYKKDVLVAQATERVKAGLVLSAIAEQEKFDVSPAELDDRLQAMKTQYKDPAMQTELDKPENQQDIASRILTEKVLTHLRKINKT